MRKTRDINDIEKDYRDTKDKRDRTVNATIVVKKSHQILLMKMAVSRHERQERRKQDGNEDMKKTRTFMKSAG